MHPGPSTSRLSIETVAPPVVGQCRGSRQPASAPHAADAETGEEVDGLLDEVDRLVASGLVAGRLPRASRTIRELLGRVALARMAVARTWPSTPAASAAAARLTVAEQSLRAVLEQRHMRTSHGLEWGIIVLIAVDIVAALL